MNRYKVTEETIKNGRKKEINYAIFDSWEGNVVYRTADKTQVFFICGRMNDRVKEVEEFGS